MCVLVLTELKCIVSTVNETVKCIWKITVMGDIFQSGVKLIEILEHKMFQI